MKHFGWCIRRQKVTKTGKKKGYERMPNTGRFLNQGGGGGVCPHLPLAHPGADIHIQEDIRGEKESTGT